MNYSFSSIYKKNHINWAILIATFFIYFKPVWPTLITPILIVIMAIFFCVFKPFSLFKSKPIIWYLIFLLVNLGSILWVGEYDKGFTLFSTFIFIVVFSVNISSKNDIFFAISSFAYCGIIQVIYLFFTYKNLLGHGRFGDYLDGTSFHSSIGLSYYLIVSFISTCFCIVRAKLPYLKVLFGIGLFFIIVLCIFSAAKKAIIIPLFFIFIYNYIANRKHFLKFVFFFSIVILFIMLLWNYIKHIDVLQNYFVNRIETFIAMIINGGEDASTVGRLSYIPKALDMFYQNPVLGLGGIGFGPDIYMRVMGVSHPHNTFLEILASGGILLFVIFFWFPFYVIYRLSQIQKDSIDVFLLCMLISLLFNCLNSQSYNIPILIIYNVIGYAYVCVNKYR